MGSDTPQQLGDYEILKVLGAGGMGRVYQVRNVITDRVEAMKVLLPEISSQQDVAARFLREIKLLAALDHPHIAKLHTALTINNQLVMLMEFVPGQPISTRLASGPLAIPDALTYIEQVLDALSYAHQQHVIHRDIKPANMMVMPDGIVKLMDFGIARTENEATLLTAAGSTLGSVYYMSPEQVNGERTDERSDLYSVGISLYEMVTGQRPFSGGSSFSLMSAHVNQVPTPPIELRGDVPAGLNQVILTAIAKVPDERFQSADAFRKAVHNVLAEVEDSKTMVMSSLDTASIASMSTPLPPARTGPTMRSQTTPDTKVRTATVAAAAPAPAPTMSAAPAPTAPAQESPQATSAVVTPPVQATSNRRLFIGVGAIIALIVLVGGLFISRHKGASAKAEVPASIKQPVEAPAPPAPQPAATVPQTAAVPQKPAVPHKAAAQKTPPAIAQRKAQASEAQSAKPAQHNAVGRFFHKIVPGGKKDASQNKQ